MTFGVAEEDIMSLNDQAFAAHESAIASAKRREVMLGGLAAFLLGAAPVHAQQAWPSRAIRVVVPFSAGGAADTSARAYSVPLNDILGQSVVIENRTGGNAVVAAGAVLGAQAMNQALNSKEYLPVASMTTRTAGCGIAVDLHMYDSIHS